MAKVRGRHMEYIIYDLENDEICDGIYKYEDACKFLRVTKKSLQCLLARGQTIFKKRYKVVRVLVDDYTDELYVMDMWI